uniref:TMC domain-containing protein n=1 Tax=Macrostomum lignano TaxID=282301 RepID=A0A1I8IG09_9PLAT
AIRQPTPHPQETAVQIGKHQRQTGFSDRASSLLQLLLVINVVSLLLIVVACLLLIIMFREYIYLEMRIKLAQEHLSASNLLPSSGTFFASIIIGYHGFLCCLRVLSMMERHTDLHYNVTYPLVRVIRNYMTAGLLYRLNFYDFFAALVSSFLLEVLPKLLSLLPLPALQRSIKLNIDISYNAACLTFSAALLWLGAFFSPPLAVFGALKILTLFFYKWLILQLCFRPSLAGMGKLLTARTITTFLFLTSLVPGLFLSFLIYSLPLSPACGPFRNDGLLKDAYFDQSNLVGFVRYVTTGTPQVLLLCLFLTMLVRVRSVAMGKEDAIRALKRYIVLENSECVRLNKQINARLRRHAERMTRNQRRQYY